MSPLNSVFLLENRTILQALIAANILIGISSTLFNALVCNFYRHKQENVAHFLYFILSSVDMVCGVIPLLHALFFLLFLQLPDSESTGKDWRSARSAVFGWGPQNLDSLQTELATELEVLLPILYFLTSLTAGVSIFLSTIIAVVRTLNITVPTYRTSKIRVVVALFICVFCGLVFLSGDIVYYKNKIDKSPLTFPYMLNFYLAFPTPGHYFTEKIFEGLGTEIFNESNGYYSFLFYIGIPIVLPTLICLICMCVQIWHLATKGVQGGNNQQFKKDITITILLLTTVLTICNVLYVAVVLKKGISEKYGKDKYLLYFMKNMLPFINSLLNPIILICRGSSLRAFVKSKIQRLTRCRCCRGDTRVSLQPTVTSTRL